MEKDKSGTRAKDWEKTNYDHMRKDLERLDWQKLFESKSTSDMWEAFKCQLVEIQHRHGPVKMKDKCGRYRKRWVTKDIIILVRKKRVALVRSKRLRTDEAIKEYKESRKELKEPIYPC